MNQIKHSEAIKGKIVTTYNSAGGVGIGYLVNGEVFKTTGSYWAINANNDVYPISYWCDDNGAGYMSKIGGR